MKREEARDYAIWLLAATRSQRTRCESRGAHHLNALGLQRAPLGSPAGVTDQLDGMWRSLREAFVEPTLNL